MMDGKSEAWRKGADELLETLAVENKYIVGDMMVIFLESAGYGLKNYMPLGGVFKRAAKRGIIGKIDRPGKQALWYSKVYPDYKLKGKIRNMQFVPHLERGMHIELVNFGHADGSYQIADINPDGSLRLVHE